ncbi:MAG: RDD family protein, partial [Spirochaeta sp.]
VGAAVMDTIFVVFLFALAVRLFILIGAFPENPEAVIEQLQESPRNSVDSLGNLASEWESFFLNELSADERAEISRQTEQLFADVVERYAPSELLFNTSLQVSVLEDLAQIIYREVPQEAHPRLEQLRQATGIELQGIDVSELVIGLFTIISSYLIVPLLVILLYWSTELLFGWSAGKRLTGISVAAMDGTPGNIGLYLSRFIFKQAGLLLLVAGFLTGVWWLPILAVAVQGIVMAGFLRVLGPRRRALHDVLSGTAVYYRRSL